MRSEPEWKTWRKCWGEAGALGIDAVYIENKITNTIWHLYASNHAYVATDTGGENSSYGISAAIGQSHSIWGGGSPHNMFTLLKPLVAETHNVYGNIDLPSEHHSTEPACHCLTPQQHDNDCAWLVWRYADAR